MSDMKKLLEAVDSMSRAEKKSAGPKFPGYLKGTDPASKVRDKMVGSAQESVIKELSETAKDTATERKLKEEFELFNETALKDKADYDAKAKALQDMEREPGHDKEAIRQRKLDLDKEARAKGVAEGIRYYDEIYPQPGSDSVNGRSDDARMTARLTRQAKAAAKKAGKTFSSSEEYRGWYVRQQERQERLARQKEKKGVAEETLGEKSVSKAQFRTMAAAAHNPEFAKKVGISGKVAKEFHKADKKSSYKSLPAKVDEDGQPDVISVDVPLLIRLLEYAREDAQTDMDLHDVAERLIKLSQEDRTLTMQDYDTICPSQEQAVDEGDVVQFPKKHKGDLDNTHECPKCGGDLQGGKYMGHQVKVCMPCKQVYLPPNSGIDQQGNPIKPVDEEQEAKYGDKYQSMVQRVGQKAREQEKKKPVDINALAAKLAAMNKQVKALKEVNVAPTVPTVPTVPTNTGGASSTQQQQNQAQQGAASMQKNLSKLKTVNPQLNLNVAGQALQNIATNPQAPVAGAQMAQTKNLADLVGDALADPQKGSQIATMLAQVQQAQKLKK